MKMETSSAVVGIGTLAMINAGLAEQKGRRRLIWFLVSLVAGPLATFLIVVLEPAEKLP
jgi:ABC-type siderophore export system fused ATPase/permease subunit